MQGSPELVKEVGNLSVKERRRNTQVPVSPYGVTADYVPLYYAPRSPMMYAIHMENVPEYSEGIDPLVYLVTTPEDLLKARCTGVITDGNCAAALTEFSAQLADLDSLVDWQIMTDRYWRNTDDDGDRKRRRSAEFLVYKHLPTLAIQMIATRSETRLARVDEIIEACELEIESTCKPDWYY